MPSIANLQLDSSEKFAGNRDFIVRYKLEGKAISSGLMLYEGEDENFFLMMAQPPKRVVPELLPPREYVFIIDVSGSMHGFPLDTAKTLIAKLAKDFRPDDSFNVVLFSGAASVMSPRSLPATQENIDHALYTIDQQSGSGATDLLNALRTSMAPPSEENVSKNFIVITDGYIAEEREAFDYVRDNLGSANVFSFGIGSGVNRYLIEGLARAGMGEEFVVTKPTEARRVAKKIINTSVHQC